MHRENEGAGPDFAIKAMDQVQANVFGQVFTGFILPDTYNLPRPLDRKLAIIGLTKLLLTSTAVGVPPYSGLRRSTAAALYQLIANPDAVPQAPPGADDLSHEADLDEMGFAVAFSSLNTTKKPAEDPAPEIPMAGLRAWVIENFKGTAGGPSDWLPTELQRAILEATPSR